MKQIDRLLIEAKRIDGYSGKELTLAMTQRNGDYWFATANLWDRIHGIALPWKPPHTPQKRPPWSISTLWRRSTPNSRDVTMIIDDLG